MFAETQWSAFKAHELSPRYRAHACEESYADSRLYDADITPTHNVRLVPVPAGQNTKDMFPPEQKTRCEATIEPVDELSFENISLVQ